MNALHSAWALALGCCSLLACGGSDTGGPAPEDPSGDDAGAGSSSGGGGQPATTVGSGGSGTGAQGGATGDTGGSGGGVAMPSCAGDWSAFVPPDVTFSDAAAQTWWDAKAIQGSQVVAQAVPDIAALMVEQTLPIAAQMHCSAADDVNVTHITLHLEPGHDFVAFQSGSPPSFEITLSAAYVVDYFNQHGQDLDAVAAEVRGILVHEGAHGYSWWPKNGRSYEPGNDSFGYGEGIADFVRIDLGLHPDAPAYPGGHWNDGYTTTGHFIRYLTSKDVDFARKMGFAARDMPAFSWDQVCNEAFGVDVATLWEEYQQSL